MKKILLAVLAFFAALGIAMAAVDVNTASQADLETVKGIGPAISAKIVEERKKGAFKDANDLQERVKGIGETNVKKMVEAGLVVGGSKGAVRDTKPAAKADKAADKPAEKAAEKVMPKAADKAAEKAAADKAAKDKAAKAEKTADKAAKPAAEKSEKASKGAEKADDKAVKK